MLFFKSKPLVHKLFSVCPSLHAENRHHADYIMMLTSATYMAAATECTQNRSTTRLHYFPAPAPKKTRSALPTHVCRNASKKHVHPSHPHPENGKKKNNTATTPLHCCCCCCCCKSHVFSLFWLCSVTRGTTGLLALPPRALFV